MIGFGVQELLLVVMLAFLVALPIWMLIHCLTADASTFPDSGSRILWGLILVFLWTVGAIIYFFVIYRRQKRLPDLPARRAYGDRQPNEQENIAEVTHDETSRTNPRREAPYGVYLLAALAGFAYGLLTEHAARRYGLSRLAGAAMDGLIFLFLAWILRWVWIGIRNFVGAIKQYSMTTDKLQDFPGSVAATCPKCGHTWMGNWDGSVKARQCPQCSEIWRVA